LASALSAASFLGLNASPSSLKAAYTFNLVPWLVRRHSKVEKKCPLGMSSKGDMRLFTGSMVHQLQNPDRKCMTGKSNCSN
jgi:hypothetical protein